MKEKKDQKALEECTFMPNARSKSSNTHRHHAGSHHHNHQNRTRDVNQFWQDQVKHENDRKQKITARLEEEQMKKAQHFKDVPEINPKSRKLFEKKHNTSTAANLEVHKRLYEYSSKQKQFDQTVSKDVSISNDQNNSNLVFRPKIHKKSQ